MPRCADVTCGRWRPDLTSLVGVGATIVRSLSALQFNGRWYCSRACVEQAALAGLDRQLPVNPPRGLPPLRLGVLLRHAGAITQSELEAALMAHERTGLRIGQQLEKLGYTTAEEILRALAAQAGVSYLTTFDVSRVERGPASLAASMVRALGLVPFEVDDVLKRVSVICAAPVPRAALRALARITGWTPDVYLVTDAVFQAALEAYTPADPSEGPHQSVTVGSLAAAAALVADAAASEQAVTMRQADCHDFRWVRVEGAQQVSDVLVAREEAGCQAALTAH
jgi:hypothetical protein